MLEVVEILLLLIQRLRIIEEMLLEQIHFLLRTDLQDALVDCSHQEAVEAELQFGSGFQGLHQFLVLILDLLAQILEVDKVLEELSVVGRVNGGEELLEGFQGLINQLLKLIDLILLLQEEDHFHLINRLRRILSLELDVEEKRQTGDE